MAEAVQDQIVSAKTLAEWLDLSAVRVAALAREGVFPREGDRDYPLRASIRAYVVYCRDNPSGRRIANPDLADEKLRLTRAQADMAELQAARNRGELIPLDDVRREWAWVAVDLRARLLAVAPRVASALALDRVAAARLDEELRSALEDIADDR